MNKKESAIILKSYKDIYYAHCILEIDKTDSRREFKFLLDTLGLKKERYIVENEIITEKENINCSSKSMYEMIFETFAKYNKYINYDLNEIDTIYDDLQFEMTEEDKKCHIARISYIENNKKVA
jgi:hypothetical protein